MLKPEAKPWLHAATATLALFCLAKHASAFLERKVVNCLEEPFKCRDIYEGIDHFLMSSVDTDDVGANMAAIEEWIERDLASHSLSKTETSRMSALVQIRDLITTDGPGRCKPSTGQLLENNDIALRNAISKLEPGRKPRRRLQKIVYHYAEAYMRDCDFMAKLKRFNQDWLKNIKNFIGELIGSHANAEKFFMFKMINPASFVDEQPEVAAKFAKTMQPIGNRMDINIIYRWIPVIANRMKDPLAKAMKKMSFSSGQPSADWQSLSKLLRKHLIRPCQDFVDRFEAIFESRWALAQSRKLHTLTGNLDELDKHIAYYHGCASFVHREQSIARGLQHRVENARVPSNSGTTRQKL